MKKFFGFLKSLFKKGGVSGGGVPIQTPVVDTKPPVVDGAITIEIIRNLVVGELLQHVGAKEKGTNTDKGGIIDTIILSMGGKLGWAWCAATVCYCARNTCNKLGISYPKGLYKGFSSQALWHETSAKYILNKPKRGCAFVHTNPGDKAHGHTGLCLEEADSKGTFDTVEGNSNNMIQQRADRSISYAPVFVDVAQAIFDQYQSEKSK